MSIIIAFKEALLILSHYVIIFMVLYSAKMRATLSKIILGYGSEKPDLK